MTIQYLTRRQVVNITDLARLPKGLRQKLPVWQWHGDFHEYTRHPSIAVIGSRDCDEAAVQKTIEAFVPHFVAAGITVISGLARGVDIAAHKATFANSGRMIAVIGTSLDESYPSEHRDWQEFVGNFHLLISPFAPSAGTGQHTFLSRNHVIVALADAVFVVTAKKKSGTMSSVAAAHKYGKRIFAPADFPFTDKRICCVENAQQIVAEPEKRP